MSAFGSRVLNVPGYGNDFSIGGSRVLHGPGYGKDSTLAVPSCPHLDIKCKTAS